MPNRTAVADGQDLVHGQAASDALAVQDAVNLVAIVGCFHHHLLQLQAAKVCCDELINHPAVLAFVSKLNSLCRITPERELAAVRAVKHIELGEAVEYEVIPL